MNFQPRDSVGRLEAWLILWSVAFRCPGVMTAYDEFQNQVGASSLDFSCLAGGWLFS